MKNTLLFFFFLSVAFALHAKKIEVTNLSIAAGLPSNEVTCIIQDNLGFMWFGTTNGLCRYDGYRFKIYRLSDFTHLRMASNHIRYMAKDLTGKLWLVTGPGGVFIFDPAIEACTNVEVESYLKGKINALSVTKKGEILLGTGEGLFKYDENSSQFLFLKKAYVISLFEDSKGALWVGTWGDGFFTFDSATLKSTIYAVGEKDSLRVTGFAESKDGHMWISTWDNGALYCLEEPSDPHSVHYRKYSSKGKNPVIPETVMYGVLYDAAYNELWVATANGLVMFSDPGKTDKCQYFNRLDLGGEEIWAICMDRNHTLWVSAMGGGVSKLTRKVTLFDPSFLPVATHEEKIVTALYEDGDSCIWIGARKDVLLLWDRKAGKYYSYKEIPFLNILPENCNAVQAIVKEKEDDTLWLGTRYDGIYIVERKKGAIVSCRKLPAGSFPLRMVHALDVAADGRIWIAAEDGVYVAEPRNKKALYPLTLLNERIPGGSVLAVHCDKDGVWIGTKKYGAFFIASNGDLSVYHIANDKLNCNDVACFYRDSRNQLWIGTQGGGVSRYNVQEDRFDMSNNVRMFSDDMVYSIVEDERQNLWIATGQGLVCMSLRDKEYVVRYNLNDGLRNTQFIKGAALRLSTSDILFGGYNSIDRYVSSSSEHTDSIPSPVYMVDISVMNVPVSEIIRQGNPIAEFLPPYTRTLTLPFHQNNLTFSFSCLSYSNPQANRYAYRMEGIDRDWIYVDAGNRNISYNSIAPGSYRFEVKACNENGIWSEPERVRVTILSPPWFTWWAYCLYIAVVCGTAYGVAGMMKKRIRLQNALKIEQIEHKKSEEVNRAKLKFFTNVSHELFTPISVLQCSIDKLRMQQPTDTDTLGIMKVNLLRLQRLLQQILEFRKAETGNLKLKVGYSDIVMFTRKLCEENFSPLVQARQITLNFASGSACIMAYFDVDKLDKILYNLLSNALKYNYRQGIIAVAVSETYLHGRRHVVLKVENTGDGIPASNIPLLFKRFYEGDYRKFKTQGSGIGLSLTKDLVDLHHGTIAVHSIPGETTVFTVTLPAEKEAYLSDQIEEMPSAMPIEPLFPAIEPGDREHKSHLLLVEDDPDLLTVMAKVLSLYFNIHTAKNGVEALEVLQRSEQIELVITDYVMPCMDGVELCKRIREDAMSSHLPVIMLTAKNQIEHQLEGYQAGVDVYIPKPIEMRVLIAQVTTVIANRKLFLEKFRRKEDVNTEELGLSKLDRELLDKAIATVERHLEDSEFSTEVFSDSMNMSQSTLYRKLKSLTGMSANEFIRNVRIKKACVLLQTTDLQISEIAYRVGFTDPKYFGLTFKKEKGMSPSKYVAFLKK